MTTNSTGYQELLSTKESFKKHSPYGDFTENLYTTWSVIEFTAGQYAGHKFLSRTVRNDYVIVLADQFGSTASERIGRELGLFGFEPEFDRINHGPFQHPTTK